MRIADCGLNFAVDVVDHRAENPDLVALEWRRHEGDPIRMTFRDMKHRSNKVAHLLSEAGVMPGDRLLILLPLCLEWWECILGAMKVGGVPVLGADASSHQTIVNQIHFSGATAVIAHHEVASRVEESLAACPEVRIRIVVGWERAGWTDYDRRVSLAPLAFDSVPTRPDMPCLAVFSDETGAAPVVYTHGDKAFDMDLLDAWRTGLMVTVREDE